MLKSKVRLAPQFLGALFLWAIFFAPSLSAEVHFDGDVLVSLRSGKWTYFGGSFSAFGERSPGTYWIDTDGQSLVARTLPSLSRTAQQDSGMVWGAIRYNHFLRFEADGREYFLGQRSDLSNWPSYILWKDAKGRQRARKVASSLEPRDFERAIPWGRGQALFIAYKNLDCLNLGTGEVRRLTNTAQGFSTNTDDGGLWGASNDGLFWRLETGGEAFQMQPPLPIAGRMLERFLVLDSKVFVSVSDPADAGADSGAGRLIRYDRTEDGWRTKELVTSSQWFDSLESSDGGLLFHTRGVLGPFQSARSFVAISDEGAVKFGSLLSGQVERERSATSDEWIAMPIVMRGLTTSAGVFFGGAFHAGQPCSGLLWIDVDGNTKAVPGHCDGEVKWLHLEEPRLYFGGSMHHVVPGVRGITDRGPYATGAGYVGIMDLKTGSLKAFRGPLEGDDCGIRGYAPWTQEPVRDEKGVLMMTTGLNCPEVREWEGRLALPE